MFLSYTDKQGNPFQVELKDSLTAGRSPKADIEVDDDRVSRMHFAIHMEEGHPVLHDLQSRNGTKVNGEKADVTPLKPGDEIRVGSTRLFIEGKESAGPTTALNDLQGEMKSGKGYGTILREIVSHTDPKKNK